ncbi:MAG: hypothetical protein JW795_08690 [Chitinivibrionales bacterium]|nr:hypothetical protein [Chitinivibrionales bacterium]
MNRVCLLMNFCALMVAPVSVQATVQEQWFNTANTWYEKQQYDSAIVYYTKIITSGLNNGDVYYNRGNAYYRTQQTGYAILDYEIAKKLSPHDNDIVANLRFAQRSIIDRVPEPKTSIIGQLLYRLHTLLTLQQQLWFLLVILAILSICFSTALFSSYNTRLWLIYAASLCLVFGLLVGLSSSVKVLYEEKNVYAIVLTKNLDAKNQPNGEKILFTAHEGTKFRIRKTVDTWSLVSLPNGVSGWIEHSQVGLIKVSKNQ